MNRRACSSSRLFSKKGIMTSEWTVLDWNSCVVPISMGRTNIYKISQSLPFYRFLFLKSFVLSL